VNITVTHVVDAWSVTKAVVCIIAAGAIIHPDSEMIEH